MPAEQWSLVLAAGAGRRLASVTGGIPKQFWRPRGGPSLLSETLDRIAPLAPPARTVVVVDHAHREFVTDATDHARRARVVYQPRDRGTAAGILLAMLPALESGRHPLVMITPSDHGVANRSTFRRGIRTAVSHVQAHPGHVVLFGAVPTQPLADYGWISPGERTLSGLRRVAAFVEKPPLAVATRLFQSGALWNTMVVVARAGTLFSLAARVAPDLARVFADAVSLPAGERELFLAEAYRRLPSVDFSRDVLTPAQNLCTYAFPAAMGWSDLGTPDRLIAWLGAARRPVPAARRARATAA